MAVTGVRANADLACVRCRLYSFSLESSCLYIRNLWREI